MILTLGAEIQQIWYTFITEKKIIGQIALTISQYFMYKILITL